MEHYDLYHVPRIWRLLGLLCVVGIIASVVLLVMVGRAEDEFGEAIVPLGTHIERVGASDGGEYAMAITGGQGMIVTGEQIAVSRQLQYAAIAAVGAIVCFAVGAELFLFPSISWWLRTLVVRIWSYSDPEPSDGWFVWLRIRAGICTLLGCGVLIWGFLQLP